MSKPVQDVANLLGRWLFGLAFLLAALQGPILQFAVTAESLEVRGVPIVLVAGWPFSYYLVAMAVTLSLAGGLSVALGVKARWGAALLTIYLLPSLWTHHDLIDGWKSLALLGGCCWIMAHGPGPYSLDHWWTRQNDKRGDEGESFVATALLFEGGLAVLALLVGWAMGHHPAIGFSQDSTALSHLTAIGWGLAATIPLAVAMFLMDWAPWPAMQQLKDLVHNIIRRMFPRATYLEIGLVSLAAGIGEEMLFRGLLQEGVSRWLGGAAGPWIGLLTASVLFGLCHFLSRMYFVLATLMGVYFGALLWATGDILAPIVAHAAYDLIALAYLIRSASERY